MNSLTQGRRVPPRRNRPGYFPGLSSGDLLGWQGQRRQALVKQPQAFLEQLVAALHLAQLRQQARQFRTGLGVTAETQAALEILTRLAPETVAQA
ncbi:hypothetical protein D3C81_1971020 [compost metagenome]